MIICRCTTWFGIAALVLSAGCSTPSLNVETPLAQEHRDALLKRGRPPQTYNLTLYNSDNGPVFAGANRTHPRQTATLDFVSDRNTTAPMIKVAQGGSEDLVFLIDTSASDNWVSQETRQKMNGVVILSPGPIEQFAGHVYDPIGGWAVVLPKVRLGEIHVENVVAYARNAFGPIDTLSRWEKHDRLGGIIGFNLLTAFNHVTLDCRGREVFFSVDRDYQPGPRGILLTVPLKPETKVLTCEGWLDGEKADIVLDFAGDFEVVMADPPGTTVKQISIGDLVFRDVQVISAYELGLGANSPVRIGRQLLERFIVTIDNKNQRVIFEQP